VPRIRRFHPIAHDFNRDPEVRELRKKYGDCMGFVWQEILSIADRNEGRMRGELAEICETLAQVSVKNYPKKYARTVREGLEFMERKGWLVIENTGLLVRNYGEYHKSRERKESQEGVKQVPPSFLPNLPSSSSPEGKKKDHGASPHLTPHDFLKAWNDICAPEGLPQVNELTHGRKAKIKARIRAHPDIAFWERVFNAIPQSDFLMGRKNSPDHPNWKATLDWLIKNDDNPTKVAEGTYA